MPGSFVHLHNHTEYSLLDGAVHIKDLIAECSRMGMPAVAVTDHGNLFGAIELVMETNSLNKSANTHISFCWRKMKPGGRIWLNWCPVPTWKAFIINPAWIWKP